jgi:undecaprenyl-diphosphatase
MNQVWFQYLNGLAGKSLWLDSFVIFFAENFAYVVLLGLGTLLLFKQRKEILKMSVFALVSASLATVFTALIRVFYFHPRPFALSAEALAKADFSINQLISHAPTASFPSAHTAFFFALATGIFLFNKRLSILFFIAAFLIAISRVIGGIHWPFDIIAGAIVGIVSGIIVWKFYRNYRREFPKEEKKEAE